MAPGNQAGQGIPVGQAFQYSHSYQHSYQNSYQQPGGPLANAQGQGPAPGGTALPPPPNFQYRPPQRFHIPPEDPTQKKRRRCLYAYYGLRQAALIVALVTIVLNVNIYVSRRGRYLNDDTRLSDPIFYAMWLTAPVSAVITIWSVVGLICARRRRSRRRGGIPFQAQFGVELLFTLGALICLILLAVHMAHKQSHPSYEYPYLRYEAPVAALLGLLILIQLGLVARSYFEFSLERKRPDRDRGRV